MAVNSVLSEAQAADLLSMSPDQLYELLGMGAQSAGTELLGPKDSIKGIGKRMFGELHGQAYHLVCGSDAEDEADRNQFLGALGMGVEGAVVVLAGVLVSRLGLAAAMAGVLAALIVKRFAMPTLKEGYAAMCEVWREHLPPGAAGQGN